MKKYTISLFALFLLAFTGIQQPLFAVTHTVQVGNYYFNPSTLNVEVGDIVKWVWVAGVHTTTSSTIPAGASAWDEIINAGNPTYSYTVAVAGTYNYVCTPHIGMGMTGSFTATAPAPTLAVSPSNQNVTSSAGNTSFTVTANVSWTAVSNQAWCTVTSSGSGNGTITATYTANPSTSERVAAITVSGSGVPDQNVTVTQAGTAATLSVMPPVQSVAAQSGMTDFAITSNSAWSASSDALWCTVTSSGTGNGTLIAEYTENTTYTERTANITIVVSGLSPVTVQVIQDASTVGVRENGNESICLFPNPVKDNLKINLDKIHQNGIISLIDLTGKSIMETKISGNKEVTMNVSNLSKGCYFVRIETEEGTTVRRILISQ